MNNVFNVCIVDYSEVLWIGETIELAVVCDWKIRNVYICNMQSIVRSYVVTFKLIWLTIWTCILNLGYEVLSMGKVVFCSMVKKGKLCIWWRFVGTLKYFYDDFEHFGMLWECCWPRFIGFKKVKLMLNVILGAYCKKLCAVVCIFLLFC